MLARKGYVSLTPVQLAVTQTQLQGRDLLVSAQTGSGKTIGFGLAIAPTLLGDAEAFGNAGMPLALVIAPTRELAIQVKRELSWLYADAGAILASCVGGMDMRDERRALARGAHIVVATPGRLRDHIMRGSIDLAAIRSVVLDEADEMLDLGFREDLEFILDATPVQRQTLLFSATVPGSIAALAKQYQQDAERISTLGAESQHSDIEYRAFLVSPRDGENAVINVLRYYEAPSAIVFCNTRAMVSRLTARLSNRGFPVVALSGELTQSERSNALQAMRDGRARVCVATDVAARGIDLPKLDLVVHAELPRSHETLVHRSGRTGRAGRKGVSALVVVPASRKKSERLLKLAKLSAEWSDAPSVADVESRDNTRMLASDDWQAVITDGERPAVEQLVTQFSPEQIAAAYLRQYKMRHSAPEELVIVQTEGRKQRAPFGPSVWFSVSEGRNQNASPRHLLPMICKAGGINKDDIGAIRIAEDQSYVEIRAGSVAGFLKAIGPQMKVEGSKDITRLENAPEMEHVRASLRARGRQARPTPRKDGTPPIDWNDGPDPRRRKPKSEDHKARASKERIANSRKMGAAPASSEGSNNRFPQGKAAAERRKEGATDRKAGTEHNRAARGKGKKGPPPPKGKPTSKKNRARAAAARAAKARQSAPKKR